MKNSRRGSIWLRTVSGSCSTISFTSLIISSIVYVLIFQLLPASIIFSRKALGMMCWIEEKPMSLMEVNIWDVGYPAFSKGNWLSQPS